MKLHGIILVLNLGILAAELTMIVVYGKPTSIQKAEITPNKNWTSCVLMCFNSTPCLLAWHNGTHCFQFAYTSTVPVTKLSSGSIVAFKVDRPSEQCPKGINPPTFDNKNATGSLYVIESNLENGATWIYYQVYLIGNKWNFSFAYNKSCPIDFAANFRSDGSIICFKQFISTNQYGFGREQALRLCADRVEVIRYDLADPNTYVRIDGIRTDGCQPDPKKSGCSTVKGFNFTGPTPTSFKHYPWVTNPSAHSSPNDNCIVLVADGKNPLKADVRSCTTDGPLQAFIICLSKPAWLEELTY